MKRDVTGRPITRELCSKPHSLYSYNISHDGKGYYLIRFLETKTLKGGVMSRGDVTMTR